MTREWDALGEDAIASRYTWPAFPWRRLNMVFDVDGEHAGADGTSDSLTSEHDRWLVRFVRRDAEVVIVGAASVRTEGWFLPPAGTLCVVSRSNSLPDNCPDPQRVKLITLEQLDTETQHLSRVLCEGGAHVAQQLTELGFFDELCVTFPLTNSLPSLPDWLGAAKAWTCVSDIVDDTRRFTIWRRGNE